MKGVVPGFGANLILRFGPACEYSDFQFSFRTAAARAFLRGLCGAIAMARGARIARFFHVRKLRGSLFFARLLGLSALLSSLFSLCAVCEISGFRRGDAFRTAAARSTPARAAAEFRAAFRAPGLRFSNVSARPARRKEEFSNGGFARRARRLFAAGACAHWGNLAAGSFAAAGKIAGFARRTRAGKHRGARGARLKIAQFAEGVWRMRKFEKAGVRV